MIRLDHVAIACNEPEKLKRVFALLGLTDKGQEDVPSQGVRTHFISAQPGNPQVEILEVLDAPSGAASAVKKYLDKKGPGIHHVAFTVERGALDPLCRRLQQEGIRFVYKTPQPGAHRMRVNFIHPESSGGVLIEISEPS